MLPKSGNLDATLNVVSCDLGDEDPFSATDESMALPGLIETTTTGIDHCPLGKKIFLSALAGKTKMTMMMMKIKKVKNQAKNHHLNRS